MIYVMSSVAHRSCKIGIAYIPQARMRQLRAKFHDIRLRAMIECACGDDRVVEMLAHDMLRKARIDATEWFRVRPRTALRTIRLAEFTCRLLDCGGETGARARRILARGKPEYLRLFNSFAAACS